MHHHVHLSRRRAQFPAHSDGNVIKMQAGAQAPLDKSLPSVPRLDRKPIPGEESSVGGRGREKRPRSWAAILMFRLSNGPCKLAPQRPAIHIFPKDGWTLKTQVRWGGQSPRGALMSASLRGGRILFQQGGQQKPRRALWVFPGL